MAIKRGSNTQETTPTTTQDEPRPKRLKTTTYSSTVLEECPRRTPRSEEYTVGLITVLDIELAAAMAILDEEHNEPFDFEQLSSDDNVYIWGRIGEHNVVLAAFESGSYGIAPAATTAKSMVMSIPSLRFGLLVGIGGGIPYPDKGRDIRLGDVAVSYPRGDSGGVVQYDLGKQTPNDFERVGFLAKPPAVLLKGVTIIKANYMRGKSNILKILADVQRQMAKSDSGFAYQGPNNDRLFNEAFEHRGGNDCSECKKSCGPYLVNRSARLSDEPKVHYGLIASGNTVMKDAKGRNELSYALKERTGGECICFEMEAAGLMNDFPCIVIRGISDYADSHKNDRWKKYAAMTAAAYAKELLGVVRVKQVKQTKKAIEVIERLRSSEFTLFYHPTQTNRST
jgi:nucleoside phosphorylase